MASLTDVGKLAGGDVLRAYLEENGSVQISSLTDGSPLQSTDEFIVARGGVDYKIPASAIAVQMWENVVWPVYGVAGPGTVTNRSLSANQTFCVRAVIPASGVLHDLSVWIGSTSSGNIALSVYDTGQATAGQATRLASSGSVTCGAANGWQSYDPALAVTAGQVVWFALSADNATATFGCYNFFGNTNMETLPANFLMTPGGAGRLAGAVSSFSPSTFGNGNIGNQDTPPILIARVA